MKNVTYINAGAGSGKTYTLTQTLANEIAKGNVQPEQVILTTFTIKAASEFKEKAKDFLFSKGLYDAATRLDQAMIGTVHAVANAFINKYWFFLGLSPDMGVMAEEDMTFYRSQSLAELPTDEELAQLHEFCSQFEVQHPFSKDSKAPRGLNYDFWQDDLSKIIGFTTNYEIDNYGRSQKESLDYIRQFFKKDATITISNEELQRMLEEAEQHVQNLKKRDEYLNTFNDIRRKAGKRTIAWYKKVASKIKSSYGPTCKAVSERLTDLWHLPEVYQYQETYIRLLFELAERWKERFAAFKREKNLLDYNDMEKYMLRLLDMPECAKEIAQQYRYLFVDEYQDCSPIQVKIFDKLSELVEHSYWVGDYKQAIYAFRGSATALTKSVVDRVAKGENGCSNYTLDTSYRSLPGIVDVCNATFSQTFANELAKENIVLNHHRENEDKIQSLRFWNLLSGEGNLSAHIAKLINDGVKPSDIAVLCAYNEPLNELAGTLMDNYQIPSSREELPIVGQRATILVEALLQLLVSPNSSLAKAQIAFLTQEGYNTETLISDKLVFDADDNTLPKDYLCEVPLIAQLLTMREDLKQQSLSALVETMIIELDLYNVIKQWIDPATSASCLDTIIRITSVYENHCIQMNMPATITGFIKYLEESNPTGTGDANGVQLHTYHSSKGLQWKYVILLSLNENPADVKKALKNISYGVHFLYTEQPSVENPYPEVFIRVMPWIYGSKQSNVPDDIAQVIQQSESFANAYQAMLSERNRLLYVGMTRPRDVLILVADFLGKKQKKTLFNWFIDMGITVNNNINTDKWDALSVGIPFEDHTLTVEEIEAISEYETDDEQLKHRKIAYHHSPCEADFRDVSPSLLHHKGHVAESFSFDARIPLASLGERTMADVGNCIHQIYAGIETHEDTESFVKQVVKAHDLSNILIDKSAIAQAWQRLVTWLTAQFGPATTVYHERPFKLMKHGQIFTGSIDLVWATAKGNILIDFKTCPMGEKVVFDEESEHYAGWYAGQLDAYTDALEAAGETVLKRFIYYPVSGLLAEVERTKE